MNPNLVALSILIPLASPGVGNESLAIAGKIQEVHRRPAYLGGIGPLASISDDVFEYMSPEFPLTRIVNVVFERLERLAPMPYDFGAGLD